MEVADAALQSSGLPRISSVVLSNE